MSTSNSCATLTSSLTHTHTHTHTHSLAHSFSHSLTPSLTYLPAMTLRGMTWEGGGARLLKRCSICTFNTTRERQRWWVGTTLSKPSKPSKPSFPLLPSPSSSTASQLARTCSRSLAGTRSRVSLTLMGTLASPPIACLVGWLLVLEGWFVCVTFFLSPPSHLFLLRFDLFVVLQDTDTQP